MRSKNVVRKWRPPLALVLGGSLLAVLVLPVVGLFVVDLLAPSMGRGRATVVVALGALSATVILGWLLWRLILAPVRALGLRAETIRGGGIAEPMTRFGTPEIGELGQTVLEMAAVLQARELAIRSYADHVTHELKTPLTAIRGAAELLASDPALEAEAQQLVRTISEAEARAERLLAAARQIAVAREPSHHGTSTLSEAISLVSTSLSVEVEGENVIFPLNREGLALILEHLLGNAAALGAGMIRIEARAIPEGQTLTLRDDGPGVSAGNRTRIFEPFFTTRRDDGGTGMGLAIVKTLLLAHGADIRLEPSETGATFVISF